MLELRDVSKSFGNKKVVADLSLQVSPGEFLSILGPSGCGKTTLLRLIAGLTFPDRGTLWLGGTEITHLPAFKRHIHTVFQRYALFPHMNVYENVAFGLQCKKVDDQEVRRRVTEMLELVNLRGQEERSVTSLSGGEQQRVALIRALINTPTILLLDEPLTALDLKLRLQLQQELMAIQKRVKTTFIFVTHDQEEALNMSDRVAVMNLGKIEQLATPNEIYESPASYFVAAFVGGINRLEGNVRTDEAADKKIIEIDGVGPLFLPPNLNGSAKSPRGVLCIRPEKITPFARRPSSCENVLEGVLKAQSYLGTHNHLEVQLKNSATITVFQQNSEKLLRKPFQLNDKIYLGWQSQLSHFFPL